MRNRAFIIALTTLATALAAQEPAPAPAQAARPPAVEKSQAASEAAPDAREILRKSVELDQKNARMIRRNYTWQAREVERDTDKDGNVKKTTIKTYDHIFLYGQGHERLIAKDDKPLSEKEEQEEEKKIAKLKEKAEHETEADREKRRAEREKNDEEGRKFLRQIPEAYDAEVAGSEIVNGRDAWMIALTPRRDFKPTVKYADILKKIKATLWIDKQDYQWVKADATLLEDASFGLFLVRLHKGARVQFDNQKINDELWVPRWSRVEGSARVALFVNARGDDETTFSNFKKFGAEAKITGVAEIPSEGSPQAAPKVQPPNP
jgi:hypothetical protein